MKKIVLLLLGIFMLVACSNEKSEDNIHSLIVSKEGKILEENYFNGKSANELANVQSITKSVISLLVGIAIDKAYIQNEDIPISTFFLEESSLFEEDKRNITIRHLLNHTSGLEWAGYKEHDAFLKSENPTKYVLEKKLSKQPGKAYNYNSGGTHLLSAILEKAIGKPTLEFAKEVLFDPLNIKELDWKKLNDGIYDGAGFGLSLKPKDLVKIGELFSEEGSDILSKTWINKSKDDELKMKTKWGIRNSTHGYNWYSTTIKETEIFYSMGYGGQFIFIIPSKKMVIVSTHNIDTPNGIEQQSDFIRNSLPKILNNYSG